MPPKNRSKLARRNAGLSVSQAARLLNVTVEEVIKWEDSDLVFGNIGHQNMCDVYGVNGKWLAGAGDRFNHDAIKDVKGYDELSFHDRDILAEFAAAMPRTNPKAKP